MAINGNFQGAIHLYQNQAVSGDFATANPRASVVAGENQLIAGPNGVNVGCFAWLDVNGFVTNVNPGSGSPLGYVGRQQGEALITQWLGAASMNIPSGREVTLFEAGDFWGLSSVAAPVAGQGVFAKSADGTIQTAAVGSPPTGYVATKFTVANTQPAGAAIGDLFKMTTWG